MREPLEVYAVDDAFNRCTGSIPYKSLRWVRRYTKPGEFELVVPVNIYSPDWAFICTWNRPETGIIQKVQYDDDVSSYAGIDSVTLSGFFLEVILNDIVFLSESPEEQKVYVSEPKAPSVYRSTLKTNVYTDPTGEYYYENVSGDIVSTKDGRVVSDTGLNKVDVVGSAEDWSRDKAIPTYDYYTNSNKTQVTKIPYNKSAETKTYDVEFTDDKGRVYYKNEYGGLSLAVGVVDYRDDTYTVKKQRWNNLDSDEYGKYYTITVSGPWQRTETMEPITEGDSIQIVMKWVKRMMGDWILYEEPTMQGITKKVDPSFQYLGDLVYSTLYEVGASLRLEYLFETNAFILSVYKGVDRRQSSNSGNPWAVFSDTWGTVSGYSASKDTSNYKNTCYVLYDYDCPNSFDDTGWPSIERQENVDWSHSVHIPYTSKRGYLTITVGEDSEPPIETYLDMRDEKPSCDNLWKRDVIAVDEETTDDEARAELMPTDEVEDYDLKSIYEAYEQSLRDKGKQELENNYKIITNFDTGTIETDGYLRDYDLGDLVDIEVSTIGMTEEKRIIEVEEVYESGKSPEINLTIGDERLTDTDKSALK